MRRLLILMVMLSCIAVVYGEEQQTGRSRRCRMDGKYLNKVNVMQCFSCLGIYMRKESQIKPL